MEPVCIVIYRSELNTSAFEFNNVTVELVRGKSSTEVQSMQLHKLLDINEEKNPNETKYKVRKTCFMKYENVQFKHFFFLI